MISFLELEKCEDVRTYIQQADKALEAIGYTEHSFPHVKKCVQVTSYILQKLGYDEEIINLGKIAAYMHDIGNVVNRVDHAQSGSLMAFSLLSELNCEPKAIAKIMTSIGNHDEGTAFPVDEITAALILADKTDVRRSRVRNIDPSSFDIHDRVNFAVTKSEVTIEQEHFTLNLTIDVSICSVMDYFEIFLNRMILCKKAANFFHLSFKLIINDTLML